MRPARQILVRSDSVQHIGLLGGNLVVERFAPFRFTRRHPELVGLTPVVGRIDDGIAVIVANLVGVGRFTRAQVSSSAIATRFPSAVDG
jgi:hypothetical protein